MVTKYMARPPAKRYNYQRHGFPTPFYPEITTNMTLVRFEMARRTPVVNAILCLPPNSEDLIIEPLHDSENWNWSEENKYKISVTPTLPQIGFVTSGGYSIERGFGYGLGVV
jgi:hypothetical protein